MSNCMNNLMKKTRLIRITALVLVAMLVFSIKTISVSAEEAGSGTVPDAIDPGTIVQEGVVPDAIPDAEGCQGDCGLDCCGENCTGECMTCCCDGNCNGDCCNGEACSCDMEENPDLDHKCGDETCDCGCNNGDMCMCCDEENCGCCENCESLNGEACNCENGDHCYCGKEKQKESEEEPVIEPEPKKEEEPIPEPEPAPTPEPAPIATENDAEEDEDTKKVETATENDATKKDDSSSTDNNSPAEPEPSKTTNDVNALTTTDEPVYLPSYEESIAAPPASIDTSGAVTVSRPKSSAAPSSGVLGVRTNDDDSSDKKKTEKANTSTNKIVKKKTDDTKKNEKKVSDPVVPLAEIPSDDDDVAIQWTWLLIIFLLGATGKKLYDSYVAKKAADSVGK